MSLFEKIRQKLKLPIATKAGEESNFHRGEKAFVFIAAYVIALVMWALINLDRDFSMNLDLPIVYGEFPADKAPVEALPEFVRASITGEGWKLLSLYGSAPRISVDISDEQVNINQAVQSQLSSLAGLTVNQVIPSNIRIQLDEKKSKRVPVEPEVQIDFRRQFDIVGEPIISPDSITITGAAQLIETMEAWQTEKVSFSDLNQSLQLTLSLESTNDLIRISDSRVQYRAIVSEFTEGETRIPVLIRGGIESRNYSLSPTSLLIRYDIPIGQFSRAQDHMLFDAFVNFSDIQMDSTGFITPVVVPLTREFDVRIRSIQPQRVSYFQIIQN